MGLDIQLPSAIAPLVGDALVASGFPPGAVSPSGDLDLFLLASKFYSTMSISSNFAPTVSVDLSAFGGPSGVWGGLAQPTIRFSGGTAGDAVFAPRGEAIPFLGVVLPLSLALALVALGYSLGKRK